ncbi:MAG: UDP-2,3-diacylglucosamine diphosphatase [Burkholderiales bacterium]|nr:UDP-2,3-diacylglucosamine diphosphatase [Burkholderiales bacterium]
MRALFISDLHLSRERPDTVRRFEQFMARVPAPGDALYVLGDLFDYWAGDDDLEAPLHRRVTDACVAAHARGVTLNWMVGNRDFLAGSKFAERCRMTSLSDPHKFDLFGRATLLLHGDTLCTGDLAYQAFRRQVRSPEWQSAFLARPLADRLDEIEALRARSESEKSVKPAAIMDVEPTAVDALFHATGAERMIHGHTHRPARHDGNLGTRAVVRWVLPEWDQRPGYLRVDATATELEYLPSTLQEI